jgi:molybdate transport system substrate-binding protein
MRKLNRFTLLFFLIYIMGMNKGLTETIHLATASNFRTTAKTLISKFEKETTHKVLLSGGSTGKLYAQIINGAPFDLFLSADKERPRLLEEQGKAILKSRFTYALGTLALWSPKVKDVRNLLNSDIPHLALANPKLAPYGMAGRQTLEKLKLWKKLESRLVYGENISQTFNFVFSGAAPTGFVSLAQALEYGGHYWTVPASYHLPIEQQAIQLKNNDTAKEFMIFLKSKAARDIILKAGYRI